MSVTRFSEVFDPSILSRPHVAVGNGQHMACAGVAIAVALACIQLHDMGPVPVPEPIGPRVDPPPAPEPVGPPVHPPPENVLPVAANGRCFFSSMFLSQASEYIRHQWSQIPRNETGFALDPQRLEWEDGL